MCAQEGTNNYPATKLDDGMKDPEAGADEVREDQTSTHTHTDAHTLRCPTWLSVSVCVQNPFWIVTAHGVIKLKLTVKKAPHKVGKWAHTSTHPLIHSFTHLLSRCVSVCVDMNA